MYNGDKPRAVGHYSLLSIENDFVVISYTVKRYLYVITITADDSSILALIHTNSEVFKANIS